MPIPWEPSMGEFFATLRTPQWEWRLPAHSHPANPLPLSNSRSISFALCGKPSCGPRAKWCGGGAQLATSSVKSRMKPGAKSPGPPQPAWSCGASAPRDARLRLQWLPGRTPYLCLEIVVEVCLHGAQRFLISLQAVNHSRTLERRNDKRRELLRVHPCPNFPRLDSRADHRSKVAPPTAQGLARARPENGISVVVIDRRVEQRTAAGNRSAPLNKIRNQLLQSIDSIRDAFQIVN